MKNILFLTYFLLSTLYAQIDGTLDTSFDPGTGVDDGISTAVIQPDGKIIIGGNFFNYNGISRNGIARLNTDGSLDLSFNPGGADFGAIWSIALQPDGKIIIGGDFNYFNGLEVHKIARLNSDGSLDTSFNPGTGAITDGVKAILVQPDGKIILGGNLSVNGEPVRHIARLNADGSLDLTFNPVVYSVFNDISSITRQPDGKIIIGGSYTIARLNIDGSLDTTFDSGTGLNGDGVYSVYTTALQPDGKILIGGWFSSYNGIARNDIARLNADGTLDSSFDPGDGVNGTGFNNVNTIALQPDGKIIIGGLFSSYDGVEKNNIVRLNTDGTIDSSFFQGTGTDTSGQVNITKLQPDGNIIIGGGFFNYNGIARTCIARLNGGAKIYSTLFQDINSNCSKDSLDNLISGNTPISIQPGNIIVQSHNGIWAIDSLPNGTYTATIDTSGQWKATCSPSVTFTVVHPDSFIAVTPIGMKNTNLCTEPEISIIAPFLRRCFSNQLIHVEAKNLSIATQVIYNSYADVKLDSFLTINSSTRSYTSLGNYTYRFQLDSIYPGQSKTWEISTTVSCSTVLGQTLCLQANLYPVADCVLDSTPNVVTGVEPCLGPWDKSSLKVKGECVGDSIRFVISNHGVFGNGDMDCFMPIRIYVDGVLTTLDSLKIVGGDSLVIMIAGDGKTWRLEADQHPLHPGNSHPNASVEACGDSLNWTSGLVTTMSQDDADPVVDIYCGQVMGSFDPNDKTGYPLGIQDEHYILPNQQLQYVIRFQNTGTDTAFKVVIRDTLETDLNIFSVVSGVSSHPYSFRMYGPRILEWTFNNIMLPDSFVNEPKSHGFISFTVNQNPNLSDGTKIENKAAIYFDFNSPVITNTTLHTVDYNTNKLNVSIDKSQNIGDIKVYPNPNNGLFKVELPRLPSTPLRQQNGKLTICNIMGQVVYISTMINNQSNEIDLSKQPNGIYFLKVENGEMEWNKKVVKN